MGKLLQVPGALLIGIGALFVAWGWESPPADAVTVMGLGIAIIAAGAALYGLGTFVGRRLKQKR